MEPRSSLLFRPLAQSCEPCAMQTTLIGFAVRADFRRLYPANAKTPTCCSSDDNRTKVTNSVTSARSLWWHVGPCFWSADLTRTANPIPTSFPATFAAVMLRVKFKTWFTREVEIRFFVRLLVMGFAVRVRSAGRKYGPTCHQRDRADVTEFVTLVRLSSLGQHVGVLALAGYKRRKSALTAGPNDKRVPAWNGCWQIINNKTTGKVVHTSLSRENRQNGGSGKNTMCIHIWWEGTVDSGFLRDLSSLQPLSPSFRSLQSYHELSVTRGSRFMAHCRPVVAAAPAVYGTHTSLPTPYGVHIKRHPDFVARTWRFHQLSLTSTLASDHGGLASHI